MIRALKPPSLRSTAPPRVAPWIVVGGLLATCSFAHAAKAKLAWTPPPPADNITGYELHYGFNPGAPYTGGGAGEGPSPIDITLGRLDDPASPEFELSSLPSCHPVYFNVKAYRDEEDGQRVTSDFSGEVSAKLPYKPSWVAGTPFDRTGIRVSWEALPLGDEGRVDRYFVYYSTAEDPPEEDALEAVPVATVARDEIANLNAPEVMLLDLPASAAIHLAVAAECATGERRVSAVVTINRDLPEPAGGGVVGALGGGCAVGEAPASAEAALLLLALCVVRARARRRSPRRRLSSRPGCCRARPSAACAPRGPGSAARARA